MKYNNLRDTGRGNFWFILTITHGYTLKVLLLIGRKDTNCLNVNRPYCMLHFWFCYYANTLSGNHSHTDMIGLTLVLPQLQVASRVSSRINITIAGHQGDQGQSIVRHLSSFVIIFSSTVGVYSEPTDRMSPCDTRRRSI